MRLAMGAPPSLIGRESVFFILPSLSVFFNENRRPARLRRPQAAGSIFLLTSNGEPAVFFSRRRRRQPGKDRLFFIKVGNMFRFSREKRPRVHDKS
jgi:hypothetical protein